MIPASDFVLKNGLKVITANDDSNPIVCIQLYIKTGSVNETTSSRGYSHYIEHLNFKNTENYPNNKISNHVPYLGGMINAYTEYDTTCYYIILPEEHLEIGLEIIAEIAFRAKFLDGDIETEKDIIIEEIKQYENDPESSFIEWIQTTYFQNNPLRFPILGTTESIRKSNKEKLVKFYRKHYRPDNSFIIVTGSFERKKMPDLVKNAFNEWNCIVPLDNVLEKDYQPECNGFRYVSRLSKKNNDFIALVIPELQSNNPFSDAMSIITRIFTSGKQSKLYKRLVVKDRTALEIQLHSISGKQPGIMIIQILPKSFEVISDIIYAVYDEWYKMKLSFSHFEEISLLKKDLIFDWMYEFEFIESLASGLANDEIASSYEDYYNYHDKLHKVNSDIIFDCLNKYWKSDYLAIYYQGKSNLPSQIVKNINKLFSQDDSTGYQKINNQIKMDEPILNDILTKDIIRRNPKLRDFEDVKLVSGIRLILRKVCNKPTIGIALTIPVSQLSENSIDKGINFFTSNLLLYGTEIHTYDEIENLCRNNGIEIKIRQTLETTTIKGNCFDFSLETLLRLCSDLISYPKFDSKFLNIIKANATDNNKRDKNTPFYSAYNNWIRYFWGKDTNLYKPYGNITQINNIKNSHIFNWFNKYYSVDKFTIAIVGDIEFDKVTDLCNKYFKPGNNDRPIVETHYYYNQAHNQLITRKTNSNQSNLIYGGFGSPASDYKSNTAFFVLSQILGGELSSRFYNILREKYGYTYQTGFDFTSIRNLGFWFAYAICDKSDQNKVHNIIMSILADVCRNGVTYDELISAKNYLKGMHRYDMESISWQASNLSILYALDYDYDYFMGREDRINSVDNDIILNLAKKWLSPENIFAYIER